MPRVKRTLPGFDLREALRDVAVDRAQAIGPQIYEGLRRLIIRSRLPSGAPLHESDIASACNISRTPVRAALHQLALEGLVTTWPQVGSVVASIDRAEIEAGVVIRRALEGEVVRLLCAAPPAAPFWPRIEALLEAQRAAVERGDDYAFFAADEQFHAALAEMAGVPAAWRLVHSVKAHIDRVRLLATRLQPRRYQDAYEEHLAILAAVRRGQAEEAAREMTRHVEAVLNSFDLLAAARAATQA
ncbi:GntR family transcriptional regulator [Azorhizobium doebereinerae]|uniref:GntR family transcriptional regulator n=1 Tax=Azorhizobium doebereinerae TaxID=281091 RepID=UPI00040807A8|nr:GntR family transcriptional regulator [Azorhizobium doebereinerae]